MAKCYVVLRNPLSSAGLCGGLKSTACLSAGTDFTTKKSWAALLKSIAMAGVKLPVVKMGALLLVGSTVARVDMGREFGLGCFE